MKSALETINAAQGAFDDLHSIYGLREYEAMFALVDAMANVYHTKMLSSESGDLLKNQAIACALMKLREAMTDRTGNTSFLL